MEQSDSLNKRKQTLYILEEHGFTVGYAKRQYQVKGIQRGNTQLKATIKASEEITDLRKINKQIIQDYKADVMASKNSMETKALKLRPVKRLFEYLLQNNCLLINPTEGLVEICRKNRKIQSVLTIQEMQKLMQ